MTEHGSAKNKKKKRKGNVGMNIVLGRKMFKKRKLAAGGYSRYGKYVFWINIWGFGIILTNTCKGLKYDLSICN